MKRNKSKKIKRNHKKWNQSEMELFNNFIKEHKEMLVTILYKNINKGLHIFRKTNGFFQKMSERINRSAPKCKSKFQKYEKKIYCEVLLVPELHYNFFNFLRRNSLKEHNLTSSQTNDPMIQDYIYLKREVDKIIKDNGLQINLLEGTTLTINIIKRNFDQS